MTAFGAARAAEFQGVIGIGRNGFDPYPAALAVVKELDGLRLAEVFLHGCGIDIEHAVGADGHPGGLLLAPGFRGVGFECHEALNKKFKWMLNQTKTHYRLIDRIPNFQN